MVQKLNLIFSTFIRHQMPVFIRFYPFWGYLQKGLEAGNPLHLCSFSVFYFSNHSSVIFLFVSNF